LEKAQEAKRKWKEEGNKGKTSSSGMHISSCDLKIVVYAIGIVNLDGNSISANLTRRLEMMRRTEIVIFLVNVSLICVTPTLLTLPIKEVTEGKDLSLWKKNLVPMPANRVWKLRYRMVGIGELLGIERWWKMIGLIWNIRGLGLIGRIPTLVSKIRDNNINLVGILETKKEFLSPALLRSLTGNIPFSWCYKPSRGTAGGILVGANSDMYLVTVGQMLDFSVSVMLLDKKSSFSWKLVMVYGSPYEEGKQAFIDELHSVMAGWQGPTLIGGDFNLIRFTSDKSNGIINHRWADAFNDWVNIWGLLELNPPNNAYTWTNNQDNLVMAKIDRIFVTIEWESAFPVITTPCWSTQETTLILVRKGSALKSGG
jgi:hypothetical protein